ncbi:hypothetical protein B6D29_01910 [Microgenomates bacterium UTCPR1]|nr:MAG: hypothetical protein B6D29_01910 [Microgenomates bacterium UTCPR1]
MDDEIEKIKLADDIFLKAKLVAEILKNREIRVSDLAGKIGYTSSYICHLKRLNRLPESIIDGYYSKQIDKSHLFLLSRIDDQAKALVVYERVLTDNLTLREAEDLVREVLYQFRDRGDFVASETKNNIIERLKKRFPKIEVKIRQTRNLAKIVLQLNGNLETTSKLIRSFAELLKKDDR